MMNRRKVMKSMKSMNGTTSIIAGVVGVGIATAIFMGMKSRRM